MTSTPDPNAIAAYQRALEAQGIAEDLAAEVAQIAAQTDRTPDDQATVNLAWRMLSKALSVGVLALFATGCTSTFTHPIPIPDPTPAPAEKTND
ncbi:MAG: hypothetical protein HC771_25795 [Synechococcales cyanobacterium CRU_2_2]|nr:hypothetical protein [Synechococcales cyanobacterium CRU_2_2]